MQTYDTKEAAERDAEYYRFLYEQCKQRNEEKNLEQWFYSSLKCVFTCFAATIATIVIVTDMQMDIWKAACSLLFVLIPVIACIYPFGLVFSGVRWTRKFFWKWIVILFLLSVITLCILTL